MNKIKYIYSEFLYQEFKKDMIMGVAYFHTFVILPIVILVLSIVVAFGIK